MNPPVLPSGPISDALEAALEREFAPVVGEKMRDVLIEVLQREQGHDE